MTSVDPPPFDDPPPSGDPSSSAALEEALSRCLEAYVREGEAGVERVCAALPEWAPTLREKIRLLARAGLLPEGEGASPKRIGDYRVLGVLGRGAMGVVHLAEPVGGGARVAVKTIAWPADDEAGERARERFLRETRAAARLDHPNFVRVLEVGERDDGAYLVMEHVEGVTLAELIQEIRRRGTPPAALTADDLDRAYRAVRAAKGDEGGRGLPARGGYVAAACEIAAQVADALEEVHAHGIVHRDVKPSNVLLDAEGRARLFDLGLAHVADAPALTRTGEFAGSPYYASPEQVSARRGAVDGRSDVYSLGATLYELLALAVPLQAENAAALLRRIELDDPLPLRQRTPLANRDLEVVCATATAKDVGARYATAAAFAADLRRVAAGAPIEARAPGWLERAIRQARRRPAAAAALALLALVLVGTPAALVVFNRALAAERDQARRAAADYRREAERNREVSSFWEELVADLDAEQNPAARAVAAELLRRGAARVDGERLGLPLSRALVLETLGRVHTRLGRPERALPLFDRALALRTATLGDLHVEVASALDHLAETHLALGHDALALALAERCGRVLTAIGREDHRLAARSDMFVGDVRRRADRPEDARRRYRRALDTLEAIGAERADLAAVEGRLADVARMEGDRVAAERHGDRSLELRREERRPALPEIANDLRRRASLAREAGDDAAAEQHLVEALGLFRKSLGDEHRRVREVLEELEPLLPTPGAAPARDAAVGRWLALLARHLRVDGSNAALARMDRAIAHLDAAGESARVDAAEARVERASLRHRSGRLDEAEADVLAAVARTGGTSPEEVRVRRAALARRVELARERGDVDGALDAQRGRVEAAGGGAPSATPEDLGLLALLCREAGRVEEAARWEAELARRLLAPEEPPERYEDLRLDPAYPLRRGDVSALRAYDAAFQRGISALQAGALAEAARRFEECLEIVPGVPVCSYNLACVRSLERDVDGALTALERAVADGFGFRAADVELLETDSDLAAVRGSARFAALRERVRSHRDEIERYAGEASFHVPAGVDPGAQAAVLLVLHRHGSTREEVVRGRWREVAERLGTILVAPSGRYPTAGATSPSGGMTWVEDLERYGSRALHDERTVTDALLEARRRFRVDPTRVLIAGEGLGGTVAFNVAVRAPGLFRGVLLTGATIDLDLARGRTELLDDMRLAVALVPDAAHPVEGLAAPIESRAHAARLEEALRAIGVHVTAIGGRAAAPERLVRAGSALLHAE